MEIILYDCREKEKSRQKARWLKRGGLGLIAFSLAVLVLTAGPVILIEALYRFERKSSVQSQNYSPSPALKTTSRNQEQILKEAEQYGVSTDFSLVIPKIKATAQIIANVNPANEEEYRSLLKQGVAHALGSDFPGSGNNIFLFAHSVGSALDISRYNAIFYLLKELEPGDEIIVFFGGQKFEYQVTESLKTEAKETDWLTKKGEKETLILQTCWPPGTTLQRLLVLAEPKKNS